MRQWYELSEAERVKNVYSKFTIKDFYEWWSNNEKKVMEIRIKDYQTIKFLHKKYGYPMSASGLYVINYRQLKTIIASVREKVTVWFGVNPKKLNYTKGNRKGFGGADVFIDSIGCIFIDIDRVDKVGFATEDDLRNSDILANNILNRLSTQKWNQRYCKICSGNGVQLIIPLDVSISLPKINYDIKSGVYLMNEKFDRIKQLIKRGIGKQMLTYSRRFKKELFVEVDGTVFNIGRVGALPVTKNFKYDGFRWRGIIEMTNGINIGLTDYVLSYEKDIKKYTALKIFGGTTSHDSTEIINSGQLRKNRLARFLLDNEFPKGGINNRLWYPMKLLLRDSNYNLNTKEFLRFHEEIKKKHNRTFTMNLPDKNHSFNPAVVNNFCIEFMFPLIYPWKEITKRNRKNGYNITTSWKFIVSWSDEKVILDISTTIMEDLIQCKKCLTIGENVNTIISSYIQGLIIKYNEEYTKYIFDEVLHDFLEYS